MRIVSIPIWAPALVQALGLDPAQVPMRPPQAPAMMLAPALAPGRDLEWMQRLESVRELARQPTRLPRTLLRPRALVRETLLVRLRPTRLIPIRLHCLAWRPAPVLALARLLVLVRPPALALCPARVPVRRIARLPVLERLLRTPRAPVLARLLVLVWPPALALRPARVPVRRIARLPVLERLLRTPRAPVLARLPAQDRLPDRRMLLPPVLALHRVLVLLLAPAPLPRMLRALAPVRLPARVRHLAPALLLARVLALLPQTLRALVQLRAPVLVRLRALVRVLVRALALVVLAAAVDRMGSILDPTIRTWRPILDRVTGIWLRSCGCPSTAAR